MTPEAVVAEALASAFLDGDWRTAAMAKRGAKALGRRTSSRRLADHVLAAFPDPPRGDFEALVALLVEDRFVRHTARKQNHVTFGAPELGMRPVHDAWSIPPIATIAELAAWLDLSLPDLGWLADLGGWNRRKRPPELVHYTYRWFPKKSGGARLVEAPKRSLKEAQRRILHRILDRIPPHPAAHGFVRGRDILSHAAPHARQPVVLRLDLADFFPSIAGARIVAVFHAAGYPRPVARLLAALCTTHCPAAPRLGRHLPQGAPTSPALANLCARQLDIQLAAAASDLGVAYTRYADDLTFSGDFERRSLRFAALVAAIARAEGFFVNHRKTRIMRDGVQQRVTGLVVNDRPNIARRELEQLEAVLFNCARHGPGAQNREGVDDFRAHLTGRVAFVRHVAPAKGERLAALLAAIAWGDDASR